MIPYRGMVHSPAAPRKSRHPAAVGPRLRRIEGQVRGLERMVAEQRYCPDIIAQVASVQSALRAVARELMRNHLTHCVPPALAEGGRSAERTVGELLDVVYRHLR